MEGYIKLHRKLTSWEWYDNSEMVHLFLHLVLMANHKDGSWRGNKVLRGQFITSIGKISEATGISIRTLRTCLARLEQTNEIVRKSTSHFTTITVCKYDDYNSLEIESDKQVTNHRQTNDKQTTTNNNDKNIKNDKNIDSKLEEIDKSISRSQADGLKTREKVFANELAEFVKKPGNLKGKYSREMIMDFYNYWREPNKSKTKMRWETEKTWALGLRLTRWAAKEPIMKKLSTTTEATVYTEPRKAIDHANRQ